MKAACNGGAKRIEPYLQQLGRFDARHIERLRSIQNLSKDISVRLLHSLMMKGKAETKIIKSIEPFLAQTRKSAHGRMINLSEAKACGLKIKLIDMNSEQWHSVWELFVRSDWAVTHSCNKVMETSNTSVSA
jgi:hypothetical protein